MADEKRESGHTSGNRLATQTSRIDVRDILGGAKEAIIVHDGQDYRLRITSQGKLILTK